ncbi:replication protein A 70 kDa DNA-binding subunit C-like protein [Tanacetum coccineum]|uniref:Replication protein A 70 kDa DNA-binding subunit C-like protein n=1 Tax=Tanacetum coccineum TaxID=301880 RepID=A0ABQ5DYG3_9ASTR
MVLMDEKGERIHVVVKKQLIPTFEPLLEQGMSVVITKFGVAKNGGKYPILKHPFKLNFYRHTTVMKCSDFQSSLYGFCFVPFADILNFDVMLLAMLFRGKLGVYNTRDGKGLKRVTFQLQDLQGKIVSGTLWDGLAQQLSDFVSARDKEDYVIMIIQMARIHEWKGNHLYIFIIIPHHDTNLQK